MINRHAILKGMRAARIGCDITPDGAGPLAGGIWGKVLTLWFKMIGKPKVDNAGLNKGAAVPVIYIEDLFHASKRDYNATAHG